MEHNEDRTLVQVPVDGGDLAVTVLGKRSDLAPLIVHHGAPGVTSQVQSVEAFGHLQTTRQVIVYDAAGSGESVAEHRSHSNEAWARDLDRVRSWLDIDMCLVAGISYGGFIALKHALSSPSRLQGLILCGSSARGDLTARALGQIATRRKAVDLAKALRFLDGRVRDDADLADCLAELQPLYEAGTPRTESKPAAQTRTRLNVRTHNYAMASGQHEHDVVDDLHTISAPTLVMVGKHDWITPPEDAAIIAAGVPGARLAVFQQSGHSPFREEPERFREVVQDFIAGIEGSSSDPVKGASHA